MIMSNQYRNDLGSPELIQVKESEPLGGESEADGVTPLRYTLANRQPTLTMTDTDMTTTEGSDEDGNGPETHNANGIVDDMGDIGLAWEHLDGLWEDDRIFHAFDCECCKTMKTREWDSHF